MKTRNFRQGKQMNKTMNRQIRRSGMSDFECYSREFSMAQEVLIPELELESFQPPRSQPLAARPPRAGSIRFGWIGSGQCGGRLVETFYQLGHDKALAVNTTGKDLQPLEMPDEHKLLMKVGRGGAGKNTARGREAIQRYGADLFSRMEEVFSDEVDHLMICFGAGGGTGGGSVPELIDLATNYARLLRFRKPQRRVGVLMTLPLAGEVRSTKVAKNAYTVATELTRLARENRISPLILVDNDRIKQVCPRLTVKEYWPTVNRRVGELFDIFNRLSSRPSRYTSFDPMDYSQVLTAGGCTVMGLTEVKEIPDKRAVSKAIRRTLKNSLLAGDYTLCKAQAAASVVVGGKQMMAQVAGLQDAINYGFDALTAVTGRAVVHRGIYEDDCERLRVYTMISGLPAPRRRLEKLKP